MLLLYSYLAKVRKVEFGYFRQIAQIKIIFERILPKFNNFERVTAYLLNLNGVKFQIEKSTTKHRNKLRRSHNFLSDRRGLNEPDFSFEM